MTHSQQYKGLTRREFLRGLGLATVEGSVLGVRGFPRRAIAQEPSSSSLEERVYRVSFMQPDKKLDFEGTAQEIAKEYRAEFLPNLPEQYKGVNNAIENVALSLQKDSSYLARMALMSDPTFMIPLIKKTPSGELIGQESEGHPIPVGFGMSTRYKGREYYILFDFKAKVIKKDLSGVSIAPVDLRWYMGVERTGTMDEHMLWGTGEQEHWYIRGDSSRKRNFGIFANENIMNELDLTGMRKKIDEGLKKQVIRYDKNWRPVFKK